MKIESAYRYLMVLTGPPGGYGTVALLLVVGTAMAGGGTAFVWYNWTVGAPAIGPFVAGGAVALFGYGALIGGFGTLLTRDRLVLDLSHQTGRWTRRLFGRDMAKPIDFELRFAKRVAIEPYTESTGSGRASGPGTGSVRKVRARLLVTKPRRAIVLDDGELGSLKRVRGVATAVAEFLEIEVDDRSGEEEA
jgi:hypothetical protein